jgi:hypothetical protein
MTAPVSAAPTQATILFRREGRHRYASQKETPTNTVDRIRTGV